MCFFATSSPLFHTLDATWVYLPLSDLRANTRLAKANNENNCAVFLASPRYRTFR